MDFDLAVGKGDSNPGAFSIETKSHHGAFRLLLRRSMRRHVENLTALYGHGRRVQDLDFVSRRHSDELSIGTKSCARKSIGKLPKLLVSGNRRELLTLQ